MIVRVTKLDIKRGSRSQSFNCPVARAIKRSTRRKVSVGLNTIVVGLNLYETPAGVYNFINDFDSFHSVKPFEFELLEPYHFVHMARGAWRVLNEI